MTLQMVALGFELEFRVVRCDGVMCVCQSRVGALLACWLLVPHAATLPQCTSHFPLCPIPPMAPPSKAKCASGGPQASPHFPTTPHHNIGPHMHAPPTLCITSPNPCPPLDSRPCSSTAAGPYTCTS